MKKELLLVGLISMCIVWGIQSTGTAFNGSGQWSDAGRVEPFRVGELIGMTVTNEQGQILGTVEDVIANERGQIGYVILSVDGDLGLTQRWTPVPWDAADVQVQRDRVIMQLSTYQLENAPSFRKGDLPEFQRPQVQQRINSYYQRDQYRERDRYERYPADDRYERRYPDEDRYERYPDDRYERRYPDEDSYERRYPREGSYEPSYDDEAQFGEYESERIGEGTSPYDGRRYPQEEESGIIEDIF